MSSFTGANERPRLPAHLRRAEVAVRGGVARQSASSGKKGEASWTGMGQGRRGCEARAMAPPLDLRATDPLMRLRRGLQEALLGLLP